MRGKATHPTTHVVVIKQGGQRVAHPTGAGGVVDYFEILARVGCRGLPLLVVGGETPALAKNRQKAA